MTRVAHVWIDSAVSSVCSTALLWGLVDLDMFDNQVAGVKAFGVGVRFGILEETEEEFRGLDRMAGSRDTKLFACDMVSVRRCRCIVHPSSFQVT